MLSTLLRRLTAAVVPGEVDAAEGGWPGVWDEEVEGCGLDG